MPNNLQLIVDLSDGSTVVGSFIYIQQTRPLPQYFDPSIHALPKSIWTLAIMSDILGRLEINTRHIVRIGTAPEHLTEIKNPLDVCSYIQSVFFA